jgi:ribulose-5-phosphate 4-epimerase/fuculose-1-phosphate aldolase
MKYSTDFQSIRDQVSPQEWQARLDLAACYRLVDSYGMTDLIYNHITARIPGSPDHLLINLYGLLYREITASSLVKIDVEGEIIWKPDTDYGINKSGYVIHGAIHKARPEVQCVLHTHTRAGMAVAAMKCGLLPLSQTSICFVGHIGYHDYEGPAVEIDERERLVRDLGPHDAMIMRNHGLLSCGATIQQAFNTMYQLEMSCRSQVDAMAARTELTMPGENVLAHTAHLYQPGTAALRCAGMAGHVAAPRGAGEDFRLSAVLAVGAPEGADKPLLLKKRAAIVTFQSTVAVGGIVSWRCVDRSIHSSIVNLPTWLNNK